MEEWEREQEAKEQVYFGLFCGSHLQISMSESEEFYFGSGEAGTGKRGEGEGRKGWSVFIGLCPMHIPLEEIG